MQIKYDVGVGGASATGYVIVNDDATDDEIRLEIMSSLYEVIYKKHEDDESTLRITYEVNVGGGCTMGETFVSKDATDDDILLEISYRLYYFEYEKIEE